MFLEVTHFEKYYIFRRKLFAKPITIFLKRLLAAPRQNSSQTHDVSFPTSKKKSLHSGKHYI